VTLSYNNVERFIKPVFSHLGVHQLRNLVLIVYGIMHSRSLECAEIVRHVPTQTNHHHTKKRIHRFLDNENVDLSVLMKCCCRFVAMMLLYSFSFRTYLPVLVDITWVNGEKYLVAAIPFFYRSIPIAFRRFTDEEIRSGTSQNLIEEAFFSWLKDALSGYEVVIVADRGFRRASLLKYLRQLELHYVIRVCGNVWISTHENARMSGCRLQETRRKHSGILGDIKLKAGERIGIHNATYQKTLQVPTNLILGRLEAERAKKLMARRIKTKGSKKKKLEAWYIATDLNDLNMAYCLYEKRMWIEEMFRDFKSRFHWCGYKVETEERREMLTFCLMVSYTIVALLGYQVQKTGRAPMVSSYGKSSITWLGISILNHRKASASALFRQIRRRRDRFAYKYAA
jgi:hypothetical protein